MAKIVAKFSTGYTDEYKGTREVKAAWMVVLPHGKILSGHSNNVPTAEKTARNSAAQMFPNDKFHYQSLKSMARWMHMQAHVRKLLNQYGFKSVKEHDAALAAARSAFVSSCKIEVIAL